MTIIELTIKLIVTLVIAVIGYYLFQCLRWTWTNQIDPIATLIKIVKKAKPDTDFIAVRDPNRIYQAGNSVGDVTGDVVIRGDLTEFTELSNTQGLNRDVPFEYRRDRYQIQRIGSFAGVSLSVQSRGQMEHKESVLKNVLCKKLK